MGNVDNSAVGWRNVIDILEDDKLEKMTYKTRCVPGRWGLFFCLKGERCDGEIGEKVEGENVEDVAQALCAGKWSVFEIFKGYQCYGGQMLMCSCQGSFLANFCMRGRKPRRFAS